MTQATPADPEETPASVEVDGDAEYVAVLLVSKSPPPQPKLVLPQVQLVKAESPARLAPVK